VKFTDRSLGSPTAWNWDFGDGIQSADQNPVHSFAAGGAYDVKLTVSRDGDSDTSTQVINVGGVPVADFSGNPISVNPGEPVRFTDKTANSPTAWSWDFGDTATSTDQNPAHTYKIKGIYTISLTARNDNGKDTETKKNYINVGIGPVADFIPSVSPYEQSRIPQNVRFLDKSAGNPTSWYWDFGDGSTSTLQNPKHAYVSEGLYSVSLTAKNDFGENTKVIKDIIWVGKGPAVDFMADKTTVGVGRIVMFTDLSSNAPTNWVWDFGDGTTGNGQNPDHAYRATGVYDVTLTAYNPSTSNSVTKNQYITVLNLPRADFMADKTRGGAPMNVQFTDTSAGSPTSWKWDFGDGASSTERNPKHQYTALGSYTVTLIASNPNGQDTTSKTNYIVTTLAPVADFRVDQRIGKAPFIVQFKDLSTGNPTKWNWEFGDGTTSPEQNPRHIYAVEGAYDVRLTATNEYGSDTVFKTGSSAETAAPVITPAVVTTAATQAAHTVVATQAPPTTTAPVSLFAGLGAAAIAFVAIASAKRK
jgi:PKD repeat protein